MPYSVHYRSSMRDPNGRSNQYAPDGEPYECDRETALARFHALLESGRLKVLVFGLPVAHVRIEDISKRALRLDPSERVMLSQYVCDDYAVGPWAEQGEAAA